ncbi:hypothetical protein ASZ90_006393 [hydrocarbon metagenome]|uniref:Uncharacterized protein n=1 Tax=hydrocarbon metagenome TaxID=938273 RepID=A0A0W8FSB8_9ZZZZ
MNFATSYKTSNYVWRRGCVAIIINITISCPPLAEVSRSDGGG